MKWIPKTDKIDKDESLMRYCNFKISVSPQYHENIEFSNAVIFHDKFYFALK